VSAACKPNWKREGEAVCLPRRPVSLGAMRALVAGATGFVGRRLVPVLFEDEMEVRCVVRDASRARQLAEQGCELVEDDLGEPGGLERAFEDVDVAYFLVHMMGRVGDYAEAEHVAASEFARFAREAGVKRMVYLGGLGDPTSEHLRSRHATAKVLEAEGPPLTYFRAAMIIGAESESYELLRGIVLRLFALPAPQWLKTESQPIGVRDVVSYLRQAPVISQSAGREIQIGGPEVLTHLEIVDEMARQVGRTPPRKIRVSEDVAPPEAIAAGAAAVTSGDPEVASALSMGLPVRTVVTDSSRAEPFEVSPEPLSIAIQRAIEEDERAREGAPA
jgi:uncharacterized protein YbjT (DUF2867 family)